MAVNESLVRDGGWNGPRVGFAAGLAGGAVVALALGRMVGHMPLSALLAQVLPTGEKTAWYLSRSSAVVAYLLMSASMIWGLALSTKVMRDPVSPPLTMALHALLSWFAVGMAAFHAAALLFDSYYQYTVADLLVPFLGPYRPVVVGVGILSLYGLILISTSFAARKRIGQRNWRRLHYLTFALYLSVTTHGLLAGSDSSSAAMRAIYWSSMLTVLFLVNYRLLTLPKPATKAAQPVPVHVPARATPSAMRTRRPSA